MTRQAAPSVTFLSNGHGEDAVGALLAERFAEMRPDLKLQAFPLVDEGNAYRRLGLDVLGPGRSMPSGGLLLHDLGLLEADLRAGFLGMTGEQVTRLVRLRTDLLVVVGDVYALLLSSLVRTRLRFQVQTLVSAFHAQGEPRGLNRYFMEHIGYPERALMRHLVRRVYARDEATANFLLAHGVRRVSALGNPMLDALGGEPLAFPRATPFRVALLPGTRGYAGQALTQMLAALAFIPEATGYIAWAGLECPGEVAGWRLEPLSGENGLRARYRRAAQSVYLFENRFADLLHTAHLVLGTAGTANEQAAALGKPVVAFPIPPFYSEAFLRNQKRLLGDALSVTAAQPEAIAAALQGLYHDPALYRRAARAGPERLGRPGGSRAIAEDILKRAAPYL